MTLKHKVTCKHEVTSDFIVEAIETFFDFRAENNPDWVNDARLSLKDALLDFVSECGVGDNTPSYIVDNFLINGDFISKKVDICQWFDVYKDESDHSDEELDNIWDDFCIENAIIYNDDYACLQF